MQPNLVLRQQFGSDQFIAIEISNRFWPRKMLFGIWTIEPAVNQMEVACTNTKLVRY